MKPIIFNTQMVQAILDGRKTVTRRVIKGIPELVYAIGRTDENTWMCYWGYGNHEHLFDFSDEIKPPYVPGEIMWVRETYARVSDWTDVDPAVGKPDGYIFKADWKGAEAPKWHPSIHMPREAARIFLRVTCIGAERIQNTTADDWRSEGFRVGNGELWQTLAPEYWDSVINPKDLYRYGWDANPFVWRIEFERCEKPKDEL